MINVPRVILRRNNLVDLSIKRDPNISKYRFRGHNTLNNSFSSSVEMFEAHSGLHYMSRSIRRNKIGYVEDIKRGYTRVTFNPDDFASSPSLPVGSSTLYLRVEEYNNSLGMYNPPGPVIIIPPEDIWIRSYKTFVLYGSAPPSATQNPGENPAPDVMVINMALFTKSIYLRNLDPSIDIMYSFSEGGPMVPVPPNKEDMIEESSGDFMYICSNDPFKVASANFSIVYTCMGA